MAINYKVLAQSYPSAEAATTLYTVPSATQAVISTINVCNLSASGGDVISIAIRPAGDTIANKHYIFFNEPIAPSSSFSITTGITMAATDVITIVSAFGTSSFNVFGSEIS